LRRRLAAAARPWPASVDVALVAESDAPCSLFFSTFNVGYHLVRERFRDDLRDRVVLRFGGGDEPAPVQAALPAGAQVRAASVRVVESFGPDRALDGAAANGSSHGVYVGGDRGAAAALTPKAAVGATGVELTLVPLAERTEVLVELREDAGGQPVGRLLAQGTLPAAAPGATRRVTLRFPDVVPLFSQPYWLVAKGATGEAVWLTDAGGSGV